MTLESLQSRKAEIQAALVNTTNSVYIIQGHMQEVDYQISLLNPKPEENVEGADSPIE